MKLYNPCSQLNAEIKGKGSKDRSTKNKTTSETGLCDGSDKWGGREPDWTDLAILSLPLTSLFNFLSSKPSFSLGEGISFSSHRVAASFLAETGACFTLPTHCDCEFLGVSGTRFAKEGDLEPIMARHVEAGVPDLEPPLFPTKMALLNL